MAPACVFTQHPHAQTAAAGARARWCLDVRSAAIELLGLSHMDYLQSAGVVMLARRAMQIQRAVRKNVEAPEYGGLELMYSRG